jgi:hypothetical protein
LDAIDIGEYTVPDTKAKIGDKLLYLTWLEGKLLYLTVSLAARGKAA